MIQYKVIKNGIVTNIWDQSTGDETYWEPSFGRKAYTEIIPAKDAVLDKNGVEIEPAIAEEIIEHPAEYTIEIVDITAQVEQERINAESLAYLAATDWMVIRQMDSGVPMPEDVKQARQEARNKIVK